MKTIFTLILCFLISSFICGPVIAKDFVGEYTLNSNNTEGYLEIKKQKNGLYEALAYEYYDRGDGRAGSNNFFVGKDGKLSGNKIIFQALNSNAKVQVDFSNMNKISIKKLSGEIIGWEAKYNRYTYKPYKQ